MDIAIRELLRQGVLGTSLTSVDWNILLQDASDFGNMDGLLTAAHKLKCKPPKEALENLLLTALCKGDCTLALAACKELGRELDVNEKKVMLEGAVLSGNVQEIFNTLEIKSVEMFAIFHTSAAIAVLRSMYKKHKIPEQGVLNLKAWTTSYTAALSRFELYAFEKFDLVKPITGLFFVFTGETIHKIVGALISDNLINTPCANALINGPISNN